jgi:hypothetical protein
MDYQPVTACKQYCLAAGATQGNIAYTQTVTSKPRKKENDTITMKFFLHKDKEEKKPSPQKQECGCPSLQPSLHSHTHAFFADTPFNETFFI